MRRVFFVVLVAMVGAVALTTGRGTGTGSRPQADRLTLTPASGLSTAVGDARTARSAAAWCGTATQSDQTPNVVAGHAAHWIYAVPSDGQDRLATIASEMQTDAEVVTAWWRAQDPTREPRFDLAQLSCGAQLDVSTLRLLQSAVQLSALDARFESIVSAVLGAGFRSRYGKYLVYYDGPAPSNVCGQGGAFASGLGFAVVYLRACSGVDSSVVAIHELTHAYGAVPTGAPHMCPAPDAGHVCDDKHDLLYPFSDGSPLSALVLDAGRDDYYGHSGAWPDIQDSPWLVQLDRQVPFSLTVTGPGTVDSDVPGLHCEQTCSTTWNADTDLVLTATPANGAKLVRWGDACTGSDTCSVRTAAGTTVSALFAPVRYRLRLVVSGKGSVRSASGSVACARSCNVAVSSYAPVRLRARAAKGWRLREWGGACRGRADCAVPMSADTTVRATFVRR